ncbi:adenylate kinase [Arthrobacter ulcerisalmonis]|nr:adenylate kinase [Arthrobacter ulcerisalmonis]
MIKKILLVGPPGSGKGTQAKYIAEKLGIVAISTGDIFRQNVQNRTTLGLEAQSYMDAGNFVPDTVTNGMVRDRLAQQDARLGFLLDGYPRTPEQVDFLDDLLAQDGQELDMVLQLSVDTEELIQRLLKRAALEGRADDTAEVIRHRMALYFEQTAAVVSHYSNRGILTEVDGTGDISSVTGRIRTALRHAIHAPLQVVH